MLEHINLGVTIGVVALFIYVIIEIAHLRTQIHERWIYDNKQMMRILATQYFLQGNKTGARRMVAKLREYEAKHPNYANENDVKELWDEDEKS